MLFCWSSSGDSRLQTKLGLLSSELEIPSGANPIDRLALTLASFVIPNTPNKRLCDRGRVGFTIKMLQHMIGGKGSTLFVKAGVSLPSAPSESRIWDKLVWLETWSQAAGKGDWVKSGGKKSQYKGELSSWSPQGATELKPTGIHPEAVGSTFRNGLPGEGKRGALTHWPAPPCPGSNHLVLPSCTDLSAAKCQAASSRQLSPLPEGYMGWSWLPEQWLEERWLRGSGRFTRALQNTV